MAQILEVFKSLLFPAVPGQSEDQKLELQAVPGLMTVLDQALFRSNEGQLTATICSSHALLVCWLDTKHQSQLVLQSLVQHELEPSKRRDACEAFARQCLESSMDAIERLSTDKFAQSANLTDPYDSLSSVGGHGASSTVLNGVGSQSVATSILESKEEICRRVPMQRRKECWESPRMICPDHVWAEDSYSACQRSIRNLMKHPFIVKEADVLSPLAKDNNSAGSGSHILSGSTERQASLLFQLVQEDLPMRLYHFNQAMQADSVVTKRLYLVKSEYRAPFRAFLEAHQSLLKAPSLEHVEACLSSKSRTGDNLGKNFQKLLKTPALVELLALEREIEQLEQDIGQAIYPFSELARTLDHRKARVKAVSGVIQADQLGYLQDLVRRLKCVLCRKGGSGTSSGIRPILLDLQGFPRDDSLENRTPLQGAVDWKGNIEDFVRHLECLSNLTKRKNGFSTMKSSSNHSQSSGVDVNSVIVKGCTESFDSELLKRQLLDWFSMVERQHELQRENGHLPDEIRQAEMAMSIAGAPEKSIKMVQQRLEKMHADRQLRLDVLKELLEDLCLREMNLHVNISGPNPKQSLVLKKTSAVGFLGFTLQLAGEPLPVG